MITNHKKPYNAEWVRCPICGAKTRDRIREDTILKNYPLYCPKCKQETLIEAKKFQVTVMEDMIKSGGNKTG